MTGKFETKEEIIKWKYRGKIGAKSENVFKRKGKNTNEEGTVWGSGEEVEEEKEYLGGPIKIKITAEDDFYSSFLKPPGCVPIDVRVYLKKHFPKAEVEKEGSLKFFLKSVVLMLKQTCHMMKCEESIQKRKKSSFSSTARNMREVAHYCIIDALRSRAFGQAKSNK